MLTKLLLLSYLLGPVFADQAPLRIPSWKEGKDLNAALDCVREKIPGLQITTPADLNYKTKAAPFNLRLSPHPSFIVSPISVAQISETVHCAYINGGTVSAKSGGHSYAAYGLSADIVIEMAGLNNITVDNADQTALVQTGNRLGNVAEALYKHGKRALPHGSCPYVGSGGHTLYGGFGYYSRFGGLMADVVISAEVVLADGNVVNASATSHKDLFYAIRGGGPSFGLVTTWKFRTLEAANMTISYFITFKRPLSAEAATNAYLIWQRVCGPFPEPSDNLATAVVFSPAEEEGTVHMRFQGNWYGPKEDADAWLNPFMYNLQVAGLTPILNATAHDDWLDGLRVFADNKSLDTPMPDTPDNFFAKSLITMDASPAWLIRNWVNYMAKEG
ncbi:Glucooligosaccharide oxidase, partial [Sphaerobolus stellatus SS14]